MPDASIAIAPPDVKLNTLVEQVVKSFEKQAAKKNILLIYSDKTRRAEIRGDSLFLIQVFENLIGNALIRLRREVLYRLPNTLHFAIRLLQSADRCATL